MIELIQSIYKEGDSIKIFFNNSNKSVEGLIFKLLSTSIAIKTVDGKICGIKGEDIDSFESIEANSSISNTNNIIEPINESQNTDKSTSLEKEDADKALVDIEPNRILNSGETDCNDKNDINTENKKDNLTSIYKVGDVIPLEQLQKIDPTLKKKKITAQKSPGGRMKTIGKDFSALEKLVRTEHELENLRIVPALGEIKFIKPEMNFGFIRDVKSGQDIYFKISQIIDEDIDLQNWYKVPVVYSVQTNSRGTIAETIHKPKTIKEMIDLASVLSNRGEYNHAFHLVEQILSEYPNIFSANLLKKELTNKFPQYAIKAKEYSDLFALARSFNTQKQYDKAIECYLKAIDSGEKLESSIKDLGMLYVQLAKSEEDELKAEEYRITARLFMDKYSNELPNNQKTLYYLENFYYSIKEYDLFIDTAEELLESKEFKRDNRKTSQILCKIAAAYIQINEVENAIDTIEEALSYDPNNIGAQKLKLAIDSNDMDSISATEFESLNSGLSTYIQQTLEDYDEYVGVKTKDIESKNFTQTTLMDVRKVIDKAGAARARERAAYLLTEGKLMLKLEPNEEQKLRTVMARYCNAMALSNISDNSSMDVIRFFYNEAFTLEESWDSNVRQIALYLLTHKHSYSELISDSGKNNSIENTLGVVLQDGYDNKIWDSILTMMLNNTSISAQITSRLFEKTIWRKQAIDALKYFGITISNIELSQSKFVELWNTARENRLREYQKVITSIKTLGNGLSLEDVVYSLYEIKNNIEDWMCPLDKRRINDIVNNIAPTIDSFVKSSGYRNKETNKNNANGQIQQLIDAIKEGPTKLSYDAILPLMESVQIMLLNSFIDVVKMSEPKLSMQLLATENVVNIDRIVPIQVSISNHRDSSPIREVSVSIEDTEDVVFVQGDATAYNAIEGGENLIFKMKVRVSPTVIEKKATVITLFCDYKSGDEQKRFQSQMSLRLYSSEDFTPIPNPYAPLANGGPVKVGSNMFYGRKEFIEEIADAIIKTPSKQVIIYGQKRCGKSSVLLHLKKRLNDTGQVFCVSFSLGEIIKDLSEASFYHKILDSIQTELDCMSLVDIPVPEISFPDWNEFKQEDEENPLNTFMKNLIKFKLICKKTEGWENKNLVVMIDEFTYLYSGIKHGNISSSIMKQWKAVTQNERAQFSVVLVGQDVVPSFKNEDYAKNAFGVIEDIRLTYLNEEPARELIENPIRNENRESRYIGNAVSRIIDYTSGNPYYIQIFCARLVDTMNRNKTISVTEADVNDVARTFVDGPDAFPEDKFDNLIRAGESEDLQEYSEKDILSVLRQIAICSKNIGYCNRNDVRVLENKSEEDAIFKHLYDREVLEKKGDNNYKIQVKLFQEWLLNH